MLNRYASNHSPLIEGGRDMLRPKNVPFKFSKVWTSYNTFMKLVEDNRKLQVEGSPLFVLSQNLKSLKGALKVWNTQVFGLTGSTIKT